VNFFQHGGPMRAFIAVGGQTMHTKRTRQGSASSLLITHILLGNICVVALGLSLVASSSLAEAKSRAKQRSEQIETEHISKVPFGDVPKGPLQIFISIDQQKLHFYSGGAHVVDELVATGVPSHLTPMGVFSVIARDRYHHSTIYNNAPMPYMERITWSGVALHEGPGVGHQASHGCIRMPHDFAARLWQLPTLGMRVIIAGPELRPTDFADARLFVHKQKASAPAVSLLRTFKTALSVDPSTKTDATDPPAAGTHGDLVTGTVTRPAPVVTPQATVNAGAPAEPTLNDVLKVAVDAARLKDGDLAATDPAAQSAQPADTDDLPLPLPKPARIVGTDGGPISIFVSRKEGKIFARQDFTPLFQAPVKIERPQEPLGTHVFTALDYMPDHSTFRWNVVTLPPEAAKGEQHWRYVRDAWGNRKRELVEEPATEPTQRPPATPQQALARIQIPQDVIDLVSELIVPGSSLVVSDHDLGEETDPSGTDFIVITR
jgi:L,D-transpeptidase catalytic domain